MITAKGVFKQIQQITSELVETEICIDQNFPVTRGDFVHSCKIEIEKVDVAMALKRKPYHVLFDEMKSARCYNICFIDGAMLLLQYQFEANELISHRLCFFPNPNLYDFQSHYSEYLEDDIYLDILDPRIVVTPLRFDYDNRSDVVQSITHPASHLTIGQYENCRIPVNRPLMPSQFVSFITRNFYNTAYHQYCNRISKTAEMFDTSIAPEETKILHLNVVG